MKKLLGLLLLGIFSLSVYSQIGFGKSVDINKSWQFHLGDLKDAEKLNFNDSSWETVNLPHDWSVKQPLSPTLASCTGYLPGGIGWYRKTLEVPMEKQNQKVYLYFEGVYNRSQIFVNGKLVAERPNGYISFACDITPYVKYDEKNEIAVRVDHSLSADSRWYTGSGIFRDVCLVYAEPVHIAQWGVFAYPSEVSQKNAKLNVEIDIENHSDGDSKLTVLSELYDKAGKIVAKKASNINVAKQQTGKAAFVLNVKNPSLWSVDNPNLYTLQTKILKDGKLMDENITLTGIRSFQFDADKGFSLNGKSIKMKGVCLHHDAGVLGAASYKEVWKRRLETLKELGVNAIRTTHNPQATHLYELCDELGLLVMNEAFDEWTKPKRKWLEGWNVGKPGFEGSYDYFEEWAERDLADMVRRDRNHISIFSWSIGNEVDYPNDPYSHPVLDTGGGKDFTQPMFGGYKKDAPDAAELGVIAKRLVAVVKKHDKSRPVTAGLAGVAMSNATEYPGALDITGYNYTEGRYDADHEKYPKRIIFGSENRHELKAWKAVRDKDFIFGQFLWTGIDYLGESGRWPSRGFYSGLLDFGGFVKPRGYFRKSLWTDEPMMYIGTYPNSNSSMKDVWSQLEAKKKKTKEEKPSMDAWPVWNYEEGEMIRVVCYTNTAFIQLFLNGKPVGDRKPYDDDSGIVYWDVPYTAGKLEAVGYDASGKETVRNHIVSSSLPFTLTVKNGNCEISKDGGIAHIEVNIVDNKGNLVILADNEITCEVEGPAVLLGMEAGNNEDMTDYTDNIHRAYHGRMLLYIQATGEAGDVKIKLTSPLLKSTETLIKVK